MKDIERGDYGNSNNTSTEDNNYVQDNVTKTKQILSP